jgi:hypothetical protein
MTSTNSNRYKITVHSLKVDRRGHPYSVSFQGETIIPKTYNPSHDACRSLTEQGYHGALEVWGEGGTYPRIIINNIEKAAKWTVSEGEKHGPRVVRYRPLDQTVFAREAQEPVWYQD